VRGCWAISIPTATFILLRFPLYKGLTATLQYNFDWDNQPSEDAETEEDRKFIFLLGYEFKN